MAKTDKKNHVTFSQLVAERRYKPYSGESQSSRKPEKLLDFFNRMMSDFDQDAFNEKIADKFSTVQENILKFKIILRKSVIKKFPEGTERDFELRKIEQSPFFVNVSKCAMNAQNQHIKENQPLAESGYLAEKTPVISSSIKNPQYTPLQTLGFAGRI